MPIQGAIDFLKAGELEPALRRSLYACRSREAVFACLETEGFRFDGAEFEEAVDLLHGKCQFAEEADLLMNRANWMRMVLANA